MVVPTVVRETAVAQSTEPTPEISICEQTMRCSPGDGQTCRAVRPGESIADTTEQPGARLDVRIEDLVQVVQAEIRVGDDGTDQR